jgi:tetratricopeptide (TPR) repeat protein
LHFESVTHKIQYNQYTTSLAQNGAFQAPGFPFPVAGLMKSIFSELKRRRVVRMAGWYAAGAFVTIQFIDIMLKAFYLPPWLLTVAAFAAMAGFPLALVLSWTFDLTPEGIRVTDVEAGESEAKTLRTTWRLLGILLLFIVIAAAAVISTPNTRRLIAGGHTPLLCEDGSEAPCVRSVPLEPNRFVVLPLSHNQDAEPTLLDGEICARLIAEGLAHWQDINVADQLRVNDALRRLSPETRMHLPVDTGLAIAQQVGAGKLIMGELWTLGDTTRLNVSLYDTRSGKALKQVPARFVTGSSDSKTEFYRLARQMVLEDANINVASPVAGATTSFAALLAYDSAQRAIGEWDLLKARKHFETALQRDRNYPYAHLWLAYTLLWQNDTSEVWRLHATEARRQRTQLAEPDALLASGIAALADHNYDDACTNYRALLARDSSNFHAWYGLSECLWQDRSVIADQKSPSGWAFKNSAEEALRAHQHALVLVPSFNEAFRSMTSSRLGSMLYLTTNKFRSGTGRNHERFAARPSLAGDTVQFIPYLYDEWRQQAAPPGNNALVIKHRSILKDVATVWATSFPENTRALQSLALALELNGDIDQSRSKSNTALGVIRRARILEKDEQRLTNLAVAEVRLLFKAGQYRAAHKLAVKTLHSEPSVDAAGAQRLAGIAGLVGAPHTMASLLAQTGNDLDFDMPLSGMSVRATPALTNAAASALTYAYFGAPADSVRATLRRAHATLDRTGAPQDRETLHEAFIDRAARMAFPVTGADDVHKSNRPVGILLDAQRALWQGDRVKAKGQLATLDSLQVAMPPGEGAADGLLTQAQLYLAVGDTAGATEKIDGYLADIRNLSPTQFAQAYQPVSVVRLMAIRAELAAKANQRKIARQWARAVVDLWQDGDEAVKPTLARMRRLARL